MGAWGTGSFENDAAQDWLYDFGENDFRLIDRTLAGVANMLDVDELDANEAAEALAAAECIAAALGKPASQLPDALQEWLSENAPFQVKPEYVQMAQLATARVLAKSELRDLWAESDEFEAWQTAVRNLQQRLTQQ
jgi:hypothetical protein